MKNAIWIGSFGLVPLWMPIAQLRAVSSSRGFYASTLRKVINNLPFSAQPLQTELKGRARISIIDAREKLAAGRDIVSRSIGSVMCGRIEPGVSCVFSKADLLLPAGSSAEERPSHLDVARHTDTRVTLQRFI